MANLSQVQLRRLAQLGATARLEELRQEEAAIKAAFPGLFGRGRRRQSKGAVRAAAPAGAAKAKRTRRRMSAANRKAVSERMRKYWAERRKAKGAK